MITKELVQKLLEVEAKAREPYTGEMHPSGLTYEQFADATISLYIRALCESWLEQRKDIDVIRKRFGRGTANIKTYIEKIETQLTQAQDALEKTCAVLDWVAMDYDFYTHDSCIHALDVGQQKAKDALAEPIVRAARKKK